MTIADQIQRHIRKLPPALQEKVFDFVDFLMKKAERQTAEREREVRWNEGSLALAMRGMENEETPNYTLTDLKVTVK